MVLYPVTGGKFINFVGGVYTPGSGNVYEGPWVKKTTPDEVAPNYEGFDPSAIEIAKVCMQPYQHVC